MILLLKLSSGLRYGGGGDCLNGCPRAAVCATVRLVKSLLVFDARVGPYFLLEAPKAIRSSPRAVDMTHHQFLLLLSEGV